MCKKQKRCLELESIPHHVVEQIMKRIPAKTLLKYKSVSKHWKETIESRLFQEKHVQELIMERLPVKSLVRFKTVSKIWKSTIESRLFQERHLAHRQQSGFSSMAMEIRDSDSTKMCKKQKGCLRIESLPHHVQDLIQKRYLRMKSLPHHVQELIMLRLPVKSLLKFKCVSKQWKSTIESRLFQERQLAHRQQSADPDVLLVSAELTEGSDTRDLATRVLATLTLGSSSAVEIPTPWTSTKYFASYSSIDGLVCLYDPLSSGSGYVVNPATRWFHPIPLSRLEQLIMDLGEEAYFELGHDFFSLGFGKDIVSGTYKPVWLYNSSEIGLENATTCEVFDFTTNAWRYVTPSSPYRVVYPDPVFAYGSLHWFTECEETKIVSFDFHTETFQVLCKAPFAKADPADIVMCNLNNRLCVSLRESRHQVIWSFHSGNKTWEKTWSINLCLSQLCFNVPKKSALLPLAFLYADEKKKRLLFFDRFDRWVLMTQDLKIKSFLDVFLAESIGHPICYFPSLISF